jgi:hypothetical protein
MADVFRCHAFVTAEEGKDVGFAVPKAKHDFDRRHYSSRARTYGESDNQRFRRPSKPYITF